ncbi:MAG: acyl-CoA thioesterase [Planctomycetota bacterium]|nr:acyl-CoA thioesterase [Planctomycetota bacterium]
MGRTVTITRIVMPGQTNRHGSLFGGQALSLMDEAAAIVAHRVSEGPVVTAHINSVDFKAPIKQGWAVEVTASLIKPGRTSMQIQVETYGECLDTRERTHCTTAVFVMVAVDKQGKPRLLPSARDDDDDDGDDD